MPFTEIDILQAGTTVFKVAATSPDPPTSDMVAGYYLLWCETSDQQPVAVVATSYQLAAIEGGLPQPQINGASPLTILSDRTVWLIYDSGIFTSAVQAYSIDVTTTPGTAYFYTQAGVTVAFGPLPINAVIIRSDFLLSPTLNSFIP